MFEYVSGNRHPSNELQLQLCYLQTRRRHNTLGEMPTTLFLSTYDITFVVFDKQQQQRSSNSNNNNNNNKITAA